MKVEFCEDSDSGIHNPIFKNFFYYFENMIYYEHIKKGRVTMTIKKYTDEQLRKITGGYQFFQSATDKTVCLFSVFKKCK